MTEEQLKEIEARAKAATPGPWGVTSDLPVYAIYAGSYRVVQTANQNNRRRYGPSHEWEGIESIKDAAHIAGMDPSTTLALVEEVRRLRNLVELIGVAIHERGLLDLDPQAALGEAGRG